MGFFSRFFNNHTSQLPVSYMLGNKQAIWVGTKQPEMLLNSVPELAVVLNKRTELLNNCKLYFKNSQNELIENHEVLDLLNKPNPLQNRNDLFAMYLVNLDLFGNSFIYKNTGSFNRLPNSLWVLKSSDIEVNATGKLFQQVDKSGIIENYKHRDLNTPFEVDSILHKTNSTSLDYIVGASILNSLDKPISNIIASYEEENIIRKNIGAIGILSANNKDSAGAIPMNQKEKEKIENQYNENYVGMGKDKKKVIMTSSNVKWQPMSYPIKDLLTQETIQSNFLKIIDAYGLNMNIFSSVKGTTFENHKQSIIGAYQNTITPLANDLTTSLNEFLNVQNGEIVAKFDHLPIMQTDKKMEAETTKIKYDTFKPILDSGLITEEEFKNLLNL